MSNTKWIPNIYYEETNEGITGGLPFIEVSEDKAMPGCLFICEAKNIMNEEEKEVTIHSYANMTMLKEKLTEDIYDQIRIAVGLQPLQKIEEKINNAIEKEIEIQKNTDILINRINQTLKQEE